MTEAGFLFRRDQVFSRQVLLPVAAALLLRICIAGVSFGSNDVQLWDVFASSIREHGLLKTYTLQPLFNHPPLAGLGVAALHFLADTTNTGFWYWLKIPAVLGDVCALWLALLVFQGPRWCVWLLALNPAQVLIAAYHGNTDALCTAACIFAAVLMQQRKVAWSAVAVGVALNIKLIPAGLCLALFGCCGSPRRAATYLGVLSLLSLPFVIVIALEPEAFIRHVLSYNGLGGPWGLGYFVWGPTVPGWMPLNSRVLEHVLPYTKYLTLTLCVGLAYLAHARRQFGAMAVGALAMGTTLFFAPGFGIQYMIYPLVLLTLVHHRAGAQLLIVCSVFVLSTYAYYLTFDFPLRSVFTYVAPGPMGQGLGLLTWYLCGVACLRVLGRPLLRPTVP